MSSGPRFKVPKEDIVWKHICASENRVLELQRQQQQASTQGRGTVREPPGDGYYFKGPLDGGDGAHATRGEERQFEGVSDEAAMQALHRRKTGAHPTSSGAYGWNIRVGEDPRKAGPYFGLRKNDL